jgi:amino acid adenylation domain-containing protein
VRFLAATIGILKAGAVYVPINDNEPAERRASMEQDCRLLLSLASDPENADTSNPAVALTGEAPAYVLYTSGSTGTPKGVVVPHRGIVRLVRNSDYVQIQADEVVALASNLCFDAATFEIWGALLNGAALVLTPTDILVSAEALEQHYTRHGVTTAFLTTALFNKVAHQRPELFAKLRNAVFGGEAADPGSVRLVLERGKPQRLVNGYGPTETTTFAVAHVVEELREDRVPVGRPIANTTAFILDAHLEPAPIGVAGELYIGGPGVALGYLNEPELTAAKFIETKYGRLYRTGDLARWLPDGTIDYLGRADGQIKLRGFRIEPGEIVAALQRHPAVHACAVLPCEDPHGGKVLAAYFTCVGETAPAAAELRRFLKTSLPEYMLPAAFTLVDALPLTANGKLDARALPPPKFAPNGSSPDRPQHLARPQDQMQGALLDAWVAVLRRPAISVRDNFFDLGGHSLLLAEVIAAFKERTGIAIAFTAAMEHQTIEALADYLMRAERETLPPEVIAPVNTDGPGAPFYFFHGHLVGGPQFCGAIAEEMKGSRPLISVHPHGIDGTLPPRSIETMAAERCAELRAVQPHGPYFLGGYCNGAYVAFEVARLLEAAGEEVPCVVMFATDAANVNFRWLRRGLDAVARARRHDPAQRQARFLELRHRFGFLEECAHPLAIPARVPKSDRNAWRRNKVRRLTTSLWEALATPPKKAEAPVTDPFTEAYASACASYVPGRFAARWCSSGRKNSALTHPTIRRPNGARSATMSKFDSCREVIAPRSPILNTCGVWARKCVSRWTPPKRNFVQRTIPDDRSKRSHSLADRPAASAAAAGEVHLWRVPIGKGPHGLQASLSRDEKVRAERFHFAEDRERWVAARGALRSILARYLGATPQALEFTRGAFGKPALATAEGRLRFNLSHSGDLMLLAVTEAREIGVDLEAMRENVAFYPLADRHFAPEEARQIRALPAAEAASHFYRIWTATEAQLKADGSGFAHGTTVVQPDRWSVLSLTPAEGYAAALAVEGGAFKLACWSWLN